MASRVHVARMRYRHKRIASRSPFYLNIPSLDRVDHRNMVQTPQTRVIGSSSSILLRGAHRGQRLRSTVVLTEFDVDLGGSFKGKRTVPHAVPEYCLPPPPPRITRDDLQQLLVARLVTSRGAATLNVGPWQVHIRVVVMLGRAGALVSPRRYRWAWTDEYRGDICPCGSSKGVY